jgi:predicted flavoprotein YhiN
LAWKSQFSDAGKAGAELPSVVLSTGGHGARSIGGSGTVSKVAKQLGLCSIYIDRHEPYVQEAKQRLAGASEHNVGAANDNQPSIRTAAD